MRVDAEVRQLCAKDGGIKVYETVALPAAKFDKWGIVRIPNVAKARNEDEYYYTTQDDYYHRPGSKDLAPLEMFRTRHSIVRRSDNKILGESVRYIRTGGDYGPAHPSSFACPPISRDTPQLETSVFHKAKQ
jgi:hypothetical protein